MEADVAVIGLGTIGSMVAWELSKRGKSVIGFEQFGIGHDRSAHGGGSRRFVVATQSIKETALMKASHAKFRELERETGQQLLSDGGTLSIGDPHSKRMKNLLSTIEHFKLPHKVFNTTESMARFPMHVLRHGEMAILDELGGVIRPEQTVSAAVRRAEQLGATIHSYTEVTQIQSNATGVTIHTHHGKTYKVGKVIMTTGPWASKLVPKLADIFFVNRIVMSWFVAKDPTQFVENKFPNFGRVSGDLALIGTPPIDGRLVRISDTSIKTIDHADNFDKNVQVKDIENVRAIVQELMPGLYPDPVSVIPFMDGYTKDGFPIVGEMAENEHVILACGFSGSGFSQSSIMGEIVADLVMNKCTNFEIDHLLPNRFGL